MLRNQINSLYNKLATATGKEALNTTKTYTIPWPVTGNPQKMGEGRVFWGAWLRICP